MILVVNFIFATSVWAQTGQDTAIVKRIPAFLGKDSMIYINRLPLNARLPEDYYSKQLPFFCKKELQVQKLTGMQLKFRLGSLDYVNKLEGKH